MHYRSQLFFDLDGTLCDSLTGIENGLQYALKENGLPSLSESSLKQMIGIPLRKSLGMFVFEDKDMGSFLYENTIRSFRDYYAEKGIYESKLYDSVPEVIEELSQQHDLFLITAKPQDLALKMLKYHGLFPFFQEVGGFDGNPDFAKSALINSFLKDKNARMIGDKPEDISAGKESGLKTVAAMYGYGTKAELELSGADFSIKTPVQLLSLP